MTGSTLRHRLAAAASLGGAALLAALTLGVSAASAAPPPDPSYGTAPNFNNGVVNGIRGAGSDTTFFMMQKIGDLYTSAGLYGCTLDDATGETLFNGNVTLPYPSTQEEYYCQKNDNVDTTDTVDNWSRTEVTEGVDAVGSGAGQNQLCNQLSTPLNVDFARSSKPITGACSTEAETGYAKDGVPILDFTTINPASVGTSTFHDSTTGVNYAAINGGKVGPVASGWLPGDATSGPFNGTALSNLSNVDNGGGSNSTAFRIWCDTTGNKISDWGQLTNLGPKLEVVGVTTSNGSATISLTAGGNFPSSIVASQAVSGPGIPSGTTVSSVNGGGSSITLSNNATASSTTATLTFTIGSTLTQGQGYPIGVPLRVVGLNTNSGTEATFTSYAKSGSSSGCGSNMNANAANDPNSATAASGNPAHIALENNVSQVGLFATNDFPSDTVDQAIEASTSLYIESNGVYNTSPYSGSVTIGSTTYSSSKINENGKNTTTANLLGNVYPTARALFNIYRTDTVRGSTAGFLNWICDANHDFTKSLDNSTGVNFDSELNTIITGQFGFIRLTDTSTPPSGGGTPADNLAAPNTTCAPSVINVVTTSGSNTISLASGSFPAAFASGDSIVGDGIPSGTTITANGGGTLTLSNNANATSTTATVSVPGIPAVTSVQTANLDK